MPLATNRRETGGSLQVLAVWPSIPAVVTLRVLGFQTSTTAMRRFQSVESCAGA
jgi:hypothetical protein